MTRIDRYVLVLFLRTVLVSFLSLAGIFIVFHAFTSLDDVMGQADPGESLVWVLAGFYGPYLLLLFDMTGAVITLMAFLFTAGWLRRTGELTATLSSGISHGRILRSMVIASLAIILVQLGIREILLPKFRDSLDMKARNLSGEIEQAVSPTFDQVAGVLIEGDALWVGRGVIDGPSFRLYADFGDIGDIVMGQTARWQTVTTGDGSVHQGYLVSGVSRPEAIGGLRSIHDGQTWKLLTSVGDAELDPSTIAPGECFIITSVPPTMLETAESGTRLASVVELGDRIRNPAVESSLALRVLLHERIVRAPLDFALVLLVLPLVVNAGGRKLFVLIGSAFGIVVTFFALKTFAGTLGSNGLLVTPAVAAWIPLLVIGPLAYVRLKAVQTV
ncbi:MAG: LptF/LptG family permease [Planctomycetota bacterium]